MRALLFAALALAGSGALAAPTAVTLTRSPDKTYDVSGRFEVGASTTIVWAVLTDYEGIPGFVSSMRSSRVRETRGDGSVLVEQNAVGGALFLSRTLHVLLEVRRSSDTLRFADAGLRDFRLYGGAWEVQPAAGGSAVTYRLRAQPKFPAPAFLLSRAMKRGARELLDQVRAEIVRRELAK